MTQSIPATHPAETVTQLGTVAVGVLTMAAAVATSTSYVLQPELPRVAHDTGASLSVIGVVAGVPIVGYLLGLALLVPLADQVRSNRLIAAHLAVLAAGLLLAAAASGPVVLGAGMFVSGLCASTGAQMSSLVGRYTAASRRGRAVGTVTAGISAGIVLGRILGGVMAGWWGWREMLVVFAAMCIGLALAAAVALPDNDLIPPQRYLTVLRSLPWLLRSSRALRNSAVPGALWFLSFSLIWVGLSLALARPPMQLTSARIGLYSLAGLLGVVATRVAGTLADRYGERKVILGGLGLAAGCTVTMAVSLASPLVLLPALALFDAGLFSAQVANQSRVLGIDPSRPARFNSVYMVVYFLGGSAGTTAGGSLNDLTGWAGVAVIGTCAVLAAACLVLRSRRAAVDPA